ALAGERQRGEVRLGVPGAGVRMDVAGEGLETPIGILLGEGHRGLELAGALELAVERPEALGRGGGGLAGGAGGAGVRDLSQHDEVVDGGLDLPARVGPEDARPGHAGGDVAGGGADDLVEPPKSAVDVAELAQLVDGDGDLGGREAVPADAL